MLANHAIIRGLVTTTAALTFATIILVFRAHPLPEAGQQAQFGELEPIVPSLNSTAIPYNTSQPELEAPPLNDTQVAPEPATLDDDEKYLTAWSQGDWMTDFVQQMNLLHLATLTNRIPVLPPFTSSHPTLGDQFIPFGDIFDLAQLRQDKALPVLELADLKDRDLFDNLGCWSILQKVESDPQEKQVTLFDRDHFQPGRDVSYLSVPSWTLLPRSNQFCKFSSLSRLSFPTGRRLALESEETVNGETATKVVPHERLMCFDSLYRVVEDDVFEWDQDYSPVWNVVGQYLYFKPSVMRLAAKYLLRMFGLPEDATVPPFIAIHVTSGPSHQKGADSIHMDDTRAWISTPELAAYVEQVALEIAKETGFTITKTIVYSDIADPVWWKEVEDLGWFTVDHELEKTVEEYSSSYVEIIDATIQSMSAGFIGTADSTFSIMSQKRVQEWVGGPTKMLSRPLLTKIGEESAEQSYI